MIIMTGQDSHMARATSRIECQAYIRSYELMAHLWQQTLYFSWTENPAIKLHVSSSEITAGSSGSIGLSSSQGVCCGAVCGIFIALA